MLTELMADSEVPALIKVAVFLLLFGLAVLGISVFREKWFVRQKDPFKEVQR